MIKHWQNIFDFVESNRIGMRVQYYATQALSIYTILKTRRTFHAYKQPDASHGDEIPEFI